MHVSSQKELKSSGYFDCVQFDKKVTRFLPKIHYSTSMENVMCVSKFG